MMFVASLCRSIARARLAGWLILAFALDGQAVAWGPTGHRWVTRQAIANLQGPAAEFFGSRAQALVDRSMDADYRKDNDPEEYFRHFIDLELYGPFPFRELDLDRDTLVRKIGSDRVRKNGTVLWATEVAFQRLVQAIKSGDSEQFLRRASDLAHYVADLHQPFHASENYNGQLSGQEGIHFRFEIDLVDRYIEQVNFPSSPQRDLGAIVPLMHGVALDSHQWVDNILLADLLIVKRLGIDRSLYRWDPETKKSYPDAYFQALYEQVGDILEGRLVKAAHTLSSLWFMAWKEAHRPKD